MVAARLERVPVCASARLALPAALVPGPLPALACCDSARPMVAARLERVPVCASARLAPEAPVASVWPTLACRPWGAFGFAAFAVCVSVCASAAPAVGAPTVCLPASLPCTALPGPAPLPVWPDGLAPWVGPVFVSMGASVGPTLLPFAPSGLPAALPSARVSEAGRSGRSTELPGLFS